MSEMVLQFKNPEFHKGLNVTIRRGLKWYANASVGDKIKIVRTGEEDIPLATGMIVGLKPQNFLAIRPDDLAFEHDPACTNWDGLIFAMERAYPDFKEDEEITVVSFWIE